MGAITTATIAATALSTGLAGAKTVTAMKERRRAKRALDNYERQELDNAFENVQISTIGSDLMREDNARNMATATETIAQAGDRAIVGGLPKIVAQTNIANQQARNYLDDQVIKRDYAMGQDQQQIRAMQESRDNANISALSSQYNAANKDMWDGIQGLGSTVIQGVRAYGDALKLDKDLGLGRYKNEGNSTGGANLFATNGYSADPNSPYPQGVANPNFAPPFSFPTSNYGINNPYNFSQDMGYEAYVKKYGNPFSANF